eukprot:scaffold122213_cov32-Tisochrysis_lutea.AAC.3
MRARCNSSYLAASASASRALDRSLRAVEKPRSLIITSCPQTCGASPEGHDGLKLMRWLSGDGIRHSFRGRD